MSSSYKVFFKSQLSYFKWHACVDLCSLLTFFLMDHLLSRRAERVRNILLSAYFSYHIRGYPIIYNQTDCGTFFLRVPQSQLVEKVTKGLCHSLMRDLSFVITHLNCFR